MYRCQTETCVLFSLKNFCLGTVIHLRDLKFFRLPSKHLLLLVTVKTSCLCCWNLFVFVVILSGKLWCSEWCQDHNYHMQVIPSIHRYVNVWRQVNVDYCWIWSESLQRTFLRKQIFLNHGIVVVLVKLIVTRYCYSKTDGYSASDLTALAKDAALGPIRGLCRVW